MDPSTSFCSGQELGNFLASSDVLSNSWAAILARGSGITPNGLPFSVKYNLYHHSSYTILAFVTSPICTIHHLEEGRDLVSSSTFEFLRTKENSSVSIHEAAITLFNSLHNELPQLKSQLGNVNRLIITGHSLGGSIASLFTLWLLESINLASTKPPLCITFGSPLIGDYGLQQAIVEHQTWNSCFVHVAENQDPVPRFFISPQSSHMMDLDSPSGVYKPFGTFLLCSDSGCSCLNNPDEIAELLAITGSPIATNHDPHNYGRIIEDLKSRAVIKRGTSQLRESVTHSFQAGIVLQLQSIGIESDMNTLIPRMEKWENTHILKRKVFDPTRKLNEEKKNMARLEWYKKISKREDIGYYDSYKNQLSQSDGDVIKFKKHLSKYWNKMVAEAERKPQKEGAAFRTRWLFGGTNYRRMIEPLEIAEYYRERGRRDYINNGRPWHYIQLEQWLEEAKKPGSAPKKSKKQNVGAILTEDSCFWAHVEEALISCELLKIENLSIQEKELSSLIAFEHYIMEQINKYAVSPEIFLGKSRFMRWWRDYKETRGPSYNSPLFEFMNNRRYHQYASGCFVPV